MPRVSIVLPTYNRAELIGRTIRGVLWQSYQDWELIIVDDASTDGTEAVVKSFKDDRIRYIKLDKNTGGSFIPRTYGIEQASGEYIAALDDDTCWTSKNKLKAQVDYLDANPDCVLVGTNACYSYNGRSRKYSMIFPSLDKDIRRKLLSKNCFLHPSVMFRRKDLTRVGGYMRFDGNPYLNYTSDYRLWLELCRLGSAHNLGREMVYIILEEKNYSFLQRCRIILSIARMLHDYKDSYPNYHRALLCWSTLLLDTIFFRKLKKTISGSGE